MEVSVFELLAAAREIQGTDYVDGDGIMCGKRSERRDPDRLVYQTEWQRS